MSPTDKGRHSFLPAFPAKAGTQVWTSESRQVVRNNVALDPRFRGEGG